MSFGASVDTTQSTTAEAIAVMLRFFMALWEWNMLDYRGICPQCLAEQSVRLVGEETCIECLHVFEVEPKAATVVGATASMTPQQKKDILSLANNLSVDLKEEGHDLFVWYSQHVEQVTLNLYIGGWKENAEPTIIRYLDLRGESNHSDAVNVLVEILSITQKESENE